MEKIEAINKAREELKIILAGDDEASKVEDGIDLYAYYKENDSQTVVVLIFAMDTDIKYEFMFDNGNLLEVVASEYKWKKSYV